MTRWFIVIYHRRTFTGRTGSLMGCEQSRKDARETFLFFAPWRLCVFALKPLAHSINPHQHRRRLFESEVALAEQLRVEHFRTGIWKQQKLVQTQDERRVRALGLQGCGPKPDRSRGNEAQITGQSETPQVVSYSFGSASKDQDYDTRHPPLLTTPCCGHPVAWTSRMPEAEISRRGGRKEAGAGLVADNAQSGPGGGWAQARRGFQLKPGGKRWPTHRNLATHRADRKRRTNHDGLDAPSAAGLK